MILVRVLSACAFLSLAAGSTLAQPADDVIGMAGKAAQPGGGGAAPISLTGDVREVTVYRGQALVTRVVDVNASRGLHEIVVTDLPEALLPESLFAEGDDGAEIRSVRYRVRPLAQDDREQVRALEAQIRQVQDQIGALDAQKAVDDAHRQSLDRLDQFVAPTAQAELRSGVLNAETLTKLVSYSRDQRGELMERELERAGKARGLNEQLSLLRRELQQITAGASRTAREAVLFVNLSGPRASVKVKYLVNHATWQPSYNLRADTAKNTVGIEYQAQVRQMSGEDWGDVRMTLSTATPALVAAGPRLEPMSLVLSADPTDDKIAKFKSMAYMDQQRDFERRQSAINAARNLAAPSPAEQADPRAGGGVLAFREADRSLNELSKDKMLLDLVTNERLEKKRADTAGAPALGAPEGVSVTYVIPQATSLPSRADQQLIMIARGDAPANFARIATPALTDYVYTEATAKNTLSTMPGVAGARGIVLLAGPVSAYLGDQFVGRGALPTIAAGETFTTGFGIDPTLRASRELVERTESVQGGNRVVEFTYRLTIENFAGEPAGVRLMDRMPVGKGNEIRITMLPDSGNSQPLSTDEQYLKNERKQGLLRWDLTVPPNASGGKAFTVEYSYRVEHDKMMTLTTVGG